MKRTPSKIVVLKFGGTSVADRQAWETIAAVVHDRIAQNLVPVVVCSAAAGVSDHLEALLKAAAGGEYETSFLPLRRTHEKLASDLGVDAGAIAEDLRALEYLISGVSRTGEFTPRLRAKVLAAGELMLTKLGHLFLKAQGVDAVWKDAREILVAENRPSSSDYSRFVSAACDFSPDEGLASRLSSETARAFVTQGFIASDRDGETVLLGRGGSDVSAAYLAAKTNAERLEIWTDVPGMYSANPKNVPSARVIRSLSYEEAQELASLGAKVLHPRCVAPVRQYAIPLFIKCMQRPDLEGTVVSATAGGTKPGVKAISTKCGVSLISMESVDMWHQVGFLADAFACFKRRGVSINLISTSETNVTLSIDQVTGLHDPGVIRDLIEDLSAICKPTFIDSCALVSLVGRNIRGILHKLSPALSVFEEKKVHLVSQAANNLNITFVVDEEEADRLVRKIHAELISDEKSHPTLGESWQETFGGCLNRKVERRWWEKKKDALLTLARGGTPTYVYDAATIGERIDDILSVKSFDRVFYSMKANFHPDILGMVFRSRLGIECVSIGEVRRVLELFPTIDRARILFTPNFVPVSEYEEALSLGTHVTLDNIYPLKNSPEAFYGKDILVRVDPGEGFGHHRFVRTAGARSKFGVSEAELGELAETAGRNETRIVGLHAHVGSSILRADMWANTARFLADVAKGFPDVRCIGVGGGFGVVEKPGASPLDIPTMDAKLAEVREQNPGLEIWCEPGRFIVSESGVLLASATQTKTKGDYSYVGVDAGMNTLLRPSLYGAYHEIVNLSRMDDPNCEEVNVVGPICESGDVLGYARHIASPKGGDVILIATAGAYGRAMSSNYNLRESPRECVI